MRQRDQIAAPCRPGEPQASIDGECRLYRGEASALMAPGGRGRAGANRRGTEAPRKLRALPCLPVLKEIVALGFDQISYLCGWIGSPVGLISPPQPSSKADSQIASATCGQTKAKRKIMRPPHCRHVTTRRLYQDDLTHERCQLPGNERARGRITKTKRAARKPPPSLEGLAGGFRRGPGVHFNPSRHGHP